MLERNKRTDSEIAEQAACKCSNSDNSALQLQTLIQTQEKTVLCPACDETVEIGICCDQCQTWYHFHCETLDEADIIKIDETDCPYFSISCVYDGQCQTFDDSMLTHSLHNITDLVEETQHKTFNQSLNNLGAGTQTKTTDTIHNTTTKVLQKQTQAVRTDKDISPGKNAY